jgi:hypothetical protein
MYWYCTQTFTVKWNGIFSKPFTVSNGVRQGGVLSPKLFNVFIDDLSKILVECKVGCVFAKTCMNHLNYADDTVILAPTAFALQELLDICVKYAKDVGIVYNRKKTKCMYFKPRTCDSLFIPSLFLDGYPLKFVHCNKYLGCILEDSRRDNLDIERQTQAVYISGNMLARNFSKCSEDVKIELFRSYCNNMYGASLWSNYSAHNIKSIEVAYNNVFRTLMRIDRRSSISYCFMLANVKHFKALIRNCIFSLYKRVHSSQNTIVQCISSSSYFIYHSALFKCWKDKLFVF